jgi:hypothetical protein
MIDEKLSEDTHDMAFEGYDEVLVSGKDQCAQAVKMALLYILGEMFDNTTQGVDYFGTIFNKGGDQAIIDAMLKSTIRSTPEVTNIISYDSTIDKGSRTISINAKIDTIYGQIYLNQLGLLS